MRAVPGSVESIGLNKHSLPRGHLRQFNSTPYKHHPRDRKLARDLITGLLGGGKSAPAYTEQEQRQQKVRADFVPDIRNVEPIETPTEHWRRRKILTEGARAVPSDESVRTTVTHSRGWSREIRFKEHHLARLGPPHWVKNKEYRSAESLNYNRMRSYAQILTTPTADTPGTTLLLHFDSKRYLIGSLAEGTQRASVQMGARLLKVSECFLTGRTEWSNTGGLIGMILTLADAASSSQSSSLEEAVARMRAKAKRDGVSDDREKMKELETQVRVDMKSAALTLFGPPNLNHTLATARRFVFRKGMPVNVHEIHDDMLGKQDEDEWAPYWADENIKVWPMSITPSNANDGMSTNGVGTFSPRKRSIDEVYDGERVPNGSASDHLTPKQRDQLTVKAVVGEMFDSSWRLDTLYETSLSEVKMPATIFIRNPKTNKVDRYHGPLPGSETPLPDPELKVLVRRPWPGALVETLPHTEPAKEAISYIVRNHTQRGKFNRENAKRLKVEEGPKFSQLANGKSVLNAEGETITPDMVLAESKEGGGLAVVDLPDSSYIENLINRPEWQEPKVMAGVGAIVWICGKDVATDNRIHDFMRQHSHLQHVVSSPEYCPNNIALDSAAAATVRLRKVDPARYRVPVHDVESANGQQNYGGTSKFNDLRLKRSLPDDGVHVAARGQVVQLEPSLEFQDKAMIPPLDIGKVQSEMEQDILDEAAKAQEEIGSSEDQWVNEIPDKDAEIITLGTGSALPSKYRNVSATLVRVPGWGNILLDCGENTLGQLKRVFTPEELGQVFQDLKILVISHMHADHHLGTVGVLKAWYHQVHGGQPAPPQTSEVRVQELFENQNRLAVIAEPAMQHWLSEYSAIEDYGFSRIAPLHISANYSYKPSKLGWFIPPTELAARSSEERMQEFIRHEIPPSLLNLSDVQAVAVQHCHGARAVSITLPSGFKVSYSGDCRPSTAFARIGKGSTVCIHEATFDDELQVDAEAKNHSTTSEALGIAQAMGAKACVLTHFSQRYQKLPVFHTEGDGAEEEGKAIADHLPASGDIFEKEEEDGDNQDDGGPLEDPAATFPDQETSNGAGQQYDIPSKRAQAERSLHLANSSSQQSEGAVKLKLSSDMKVAVAFDYMRVKVGDMWQMQKFTPALLKLFAEEKERAFTIETMGEDKKLGKKEKKRKGGRNG